MVTTERPQPVYIYINYYYYIHHKERHQTSAVTTKRRICGYSTEKEYNKMSERANVLP